MISENSLTQKNTYYMISFKGTPRKGKAKLIKTMSAASG